MAIVEIQYQRDPATGQILFDSNGYPLIVPDTTANTYGQLQTRVQYEVLGSPTAADVQNAIGDAIAQFERETFWFNDMRTCAATGGGLGLQTVPGKEFYSSQDMPSLVNNPHIREVYIFAFGNRYPLVERTPQWINEQSINPVWTGLPTDWCWQAGALRLYPIPNLVYPVIIDATFRFAPLVNASDFNCWTNRAEWLIRTEAKRLLFINITRDLNQAKIMEMEIYGDRSNGRQGALIQLRRESLRRAGGAGKLRPSYGYL